MRNLIKNKKKKGFTLIEMVAVVAIIGILAAILVPKITGYMKEAKKTEVLDQARKVSQAFETAVMKEKIAAPTSTTDTANIKVNAIADKTMLSLLDVASTADATSALDKIQGVTSSGTADPGKVTVRDCINITEGAEFNVDGNGNLIVGSIATP